VSEQSIDSKLCCASLHRNCRSIPSLHAKRHATVIHICCAPPCLAAQCNPPLPHKLCAAHRQIIPAQRVQKDASGGVTPDHNFDAPTMSGWARGWASCLSSWLCVEQAGRASFSSGPAADWNLPWSEQHRGTAADYFGDAVVHIRACRLAHAEHLNTPLCSHGVVRGHLWVASTQAIRDWRSPEHGTGATAKR
jgi:hypothetical protein